MPMPFLRKQKGFRPFQGPGGDLFHIKAYGGVMQGAKEPETRVAQVEIPFGVFHKCGFPKHFPNILDFLRHPNGPIELPD